MVEPIEQLSNLREIEVAILDALGSTDNPAHLQRYYDLLREVKRQIGEVELALLERGNLG